MMELLLIIGMVLMLVWMVVGIMTILLMVTYMKMMKGYPTSYDELMEKLSEGEEA